MIAVGIALAGSTPHSEALEPGLPPLLEGLSSEDANTVQEAEDSLRRERESLLQDAAPGTSSGPDADRAPGGDGRSNDAGDAPQSSSARGAEPEERRESRQRFTRVAPQPALPDTLDGPSDTAGRTTEQQRLDGAEPGPGEFRRLGIVEGDERIVREELARAQEGRERRRLSLAYIGQLSDFQLVDTQSPSRVEFLDIFADPPLPPAVSGAWRPQEATVAHGVDQAIRQMNRFTDRSPHQQWDGSRASMALALMTGDLADNQQLNETQNVVTLLEGGVVDPNSGSLDPADYQMCPPGTPGPEEAPFYYGVQDYSRYSPAEQFYDPNQPIGRWSSWPRFPGLMDQAQRRFTTPGLDVPSYVVFGNHDALAQGNQAAIKPFEDIGVGCVKPLLPITHPSQIGAIFDPDMIEALLAGDPSNFMLVPPDPRRQYVDKRQFMALHATGRQADAHGFALVDPEEREASNGAAAYYAFDPVPGVRMIGLDTLSVGGITGDSSAGNIGDPQFQWLRRELAAAQAEDKLVIPFGHHPIRYLTSVTPHEAAPPCTVFDEERGHDVNPGCKIDPRPSIPIRLADDVRDLFLEFPNVIAYFAGHSHENTIDHFGAEGGDAAASSRSNGHSHSDGQHGHSHSHGDNGSHEHGDESDMTAFRQGPGGSGGFWGVETASLIDWPPQSRLLEVMNNCDGTLSVLATVLDTEAPSEMPEPGTSAQGFGIPELASVGRTLSFNDPQVGRGAGDGEPNERNVELLVNDPRAPATSEAECAAVADRVPTRPAERPTEDRDIPSVTPAADGAPGALDRLPFTGIVLLALLLLALALLAAGLLARQAALGGEEAAPGERLARLRELRERLGRGDPPSAA